MKPHDSIIPIAAILVITAISGCGSKGGSDNDSAGGAAGTMSNVGGSSGTVGNVGGSSGGTSHTGGSGGTDVEIGSCNTADDCDDHNVCTDDDCTDTGSCRHIRNTNPCMDDGDDGTDDVCSEGVCTHPTIAVADPKSYVLFTNGSQPQAVVVEVDPATGAPLLGSGVVYQDPPVATGWSAEAIAVAKDGTLRLLWTNGDSGSAAIWTLSDSFEKLDGKTFTYQTGWFASGYARDPDDLGHVLFSSCPQDRCDSVSIPLTVDEEIDPAKAVKTYMYSTGDQYDRPHPVSYSIQADGTGRIAWAAANSGFPTAQDIWVLTPAQEPTATVYALDNSTSSPATYWWLRGYSEESANLIRVVWYDYMTNVGSKICTYSSTANLSSMPETPGWLPGQCAPYDIHLGGGLGDWLARAYATTPTAP